MTKEELLTEIIKRQQDLIDIITFQDEEVEYFNKFLQNNDLLKINSWTNIDLTDLFIAYTKVLHPNSMDIHKLLKAAASIRPIVEETSAQEFNKIIRGLLTIADNYSFNLIEKNRILKNMYLNIKLMKIPKSKKIRKLLTDENYDFLSLFKIYAEKKFEISDGLVIIEILKTTQEEYEAIKEELNEYIANNHFRVSRKKREQIATKRIEQVATYSIFKIKKSFSKIIEYAEAIRTNDNARKKTAKKQLRAYDFLRQNFLQRDSLELIKNPETIISKIEDENLQLEILKLIYQQNLAVQQEMQNVFDKLSENTAAKYQSLLAEYGISPDMYKDEDVMLHPLAETKNILVKGKQLEIEDKNTLISLLQTTTSSYLEQLLTLISEGYITKQFLKENQSLINSKSKFIHQVAVKKDKLSEKRVNPELLSKSESSWLIDDYDFAKNLDTLEKNSLLSSMSRTTSFEFLAKKDLDILISLVLEVGLESLLEQNLNLLNYDKNRLLRIRILKDLNFKIPDKDTLQNILDSETFIVPDDKIENYILAPEISFDEEEVVSLEEIEKIENRLSTFYQTNRTYNVYGVILSKDRIKRNIEELKNGALTSFPIKTVFLKDSFISEGEQEIITKKIIEKQLIIK